MKKSAFLLLLAIISLASCENIEDNTPALQGEIDSTFFRANVALFTTDDQGRYIIQGADARETVNLIVSANVEGTYLLGGSSNNFGIYEDVDGNVYSTSPSGNGEVIINQVNADGSLTGTFAFMAVREGIDTVFVSRGLFAEVPPGVNNDDDGGSNTNNDGTIGADVNGTPFAPITVSATNTGNSIVILGASSTSSIAIQFPGDVEAGTYNLPSSGFQATYTEAGSSNQASSGSITVDAHDPAAGTLSGSFSFQAGATSVTSGYFDVTY